MQPGSNGVDRNLARGRNVAVTQSRQLAQQKHVAVELSQSGERLRKCDAEFLRRWLCRLDERGRLRRLAPIAEMIQCEIACDAKDPGPSRVGTVGWRRS